jgi:hypothetical protein
MEADIKSLMRVVERSEFARRPGTRGWVKLITVYSAAAVQQLPAGIGPPLTLPRILGPSVVAALLCFALVITMPAFMPACMPSRTAGYGEWVHRDALARAPHAPSCPRSKACVLVPSRRPSA